MCGFKMHATEDVQIRVYDHIHRPQNTEVTVRTLHRYESVIDATQKRKEALKTRDWKNVPRFPVSLFQSPLRKLQLFGHVCCMGVNHGGEAGGQVPQNLE